MQLAELELNTLATLIKLLNAFLWQEYALTSSPIFLDPEVNKLGAKAMLVINQFADMLSSFPTLDLELQSGKAEDSYYTTLHYTTLHHTTLHYNILHYTILHYTTLYFTILYHTKGSFALHPSQTPSLRPSFT